jgi:hypothetical protein
MAAVGGLWALAAQPGIAGAPLVRGDRSALLSGGESQFAAVTHGSNWFAVRRTPARAATGLRLDFGLMAWKSRLPGGTWQDTLPIRPIGPSPSAGPLLVRHRGVALPYGRRMAIGRDGSVRIEDGGFRVAMRRVRAAAFVYTPGPGRMTLSLPARARDHFRYTLFVPPAGLTPTAHGFTSDRLDARANAAARLAVSGRYASGSEHGLVAATLDFAVAHSGRFRLVLSRP